jgi:hypothetical protein
VAEVASPQQAPTPLQNKTFREFKGVNTKANRTAIPEDTFYDLVNAMPIGPANLHSVPDKSASLVDYAADTIYWSQYLNIGGTNYLISFSTTGKIFSYNIDTTATATIATGFSGSGTRMAQFKNVVALFIDSTGYYSWDGTTFSANLGGISGSPSNGTEIAVYQGRVWVVQGRTIAYSGADDGTATPWTTLWTVANGAGFVQMTDPTFKGAITRMWVQNGYLYVFAATGINIIADVYVPAGASPPTPVFTNLNINANIGTDQPGSVFAFGRSLCFATKYGVYQLYGVAEQRISEDIDGTFQYGDFTQALYGGSAQVNNILCAGILLKQLANPDGVAARTAIAMYFDHKWWFANYGAVTLITSGIKSNVPVLYGFIGNKLYQLFATITNGLITASPPTTVSIALWALEDALARKRVIRVGVDTATDILSGTTTITVDTPTSSTPVTGSLNINSVQWINNAAVVVSWQNNVSATVLWYAGTMVLYSGDAPGTFDRFVGMTFSTTGSVYSLNAFYMDYKLGPRWG